MNNIIQPITTETADALTPAQRLTVNTGYSCQCGTCETEIYLTRAEWDAIWNHSGDDVPCPVCVDGLPLPMTAEEKEAREFLSRMQETLYALRGEARQISSGEMRPAVKRSMDTLLDALTTGEDAAYPFRKTE